MITIVKRTDYHTYTLVKMIMVVIMLVIIITILL